MKYYAVKNGRKPGIYNTWEECEAQVKGYPGAKFKKFNTETEALEFMGADSVTTYYNVNEDTLVAYVDGSFDKNDDSYSYGAVLISRDEIKEFSQRFKKDIYSQHRNVIGEIKGAMFAMDYGVKHGYKKLILHYDYKGIEYWALGTWKRNKEATINYHNFYNSIKDKIEVEFVKVKAHSGDKYNELADKLAKEAVLK